MTISAISLMGVSKTFGPIVALQPVDLEIATGTIHIGMPPPTKPLSSSGFMSAGRAGSVIAASSDASPATAMPRRPFLKYGRMRVMRCSTVAMRLLDPMRQPA